MILKYLAKRLLWSRQRYHIEISDALTLSYFVENRDVESLIRLMYRYKRIRPISKSSRTHRGETLPKTYYHTMSLNNYCIWSGGHSSLRVKYNNTRKRTNAFKELYENIERE